MLLEFRLNELKILSQLDHCPLDIKVMNSNKPLFSPTKYRVLRCSKAKCLFTDFTQGSQGPPKCELPGGMYFHYISSLMRNSAVFVASANAFLNLLPLPTKLVP